MQQRKKENKSPQPVHIVLSGSGNLNPDIKFFQQLVKRWLLLEVDTVVQEVFLLDWLQQSMAMDYAK